MGAGATGASTSLSMALIGVGHLVGLSVGMAMTVGMLIAYVFYSAQFTERASKLLDFCIDFRMLLIQVDRLADIELASPEKFAHDSSFALSPAPSVEFRNVSFSYGSDCKAILSDLSFVIRPGESVAIVGPSGSGKSTVAKLMLGLLDPDQGTILFDGVPIDQIGKGAIRRISSTVFQEDCLLSGSIEENIHFFSESPDLDRVVAAAKLACIHDEINSFAMRYRTHVGSLGSSLSSGQQQRVLLARAIYRSPGLLVLDEATSHLDVENERRINNELSKMTMTRVVIAHRPETIASAGRVIRIGGTLADSEDAKVARATEYA